MWRLLTSSLCVNRNPSPDSRLARMCDWRISTTADDCGWWCRLISNREGKSRKSDSGGAEERDGGSVSTALEGEQKPGLTGEPVRIDRPTSSCQRELIWHQQSLYVKQGKGQEDPHVQSQACSCGHGSTPSGSNEQHATTTEDTEVIIGVLMLERRLRGHGESFLRMWSASNRHAIPINWAADLKGCLTFGGLIIKIHWNSILNAPFRSHSD